MSAMTKQTPLQDSIAVFLPNWIGDAVMATPALRGLRRRFGGARITFIGRPGPLKVLEGTDFADEQITDTWPRSGLVGLLRMTGRLRREKFTLAVLLPNSFRSALLAWLGRIGRRLGYSRQGRSWMLTDALPPPREEDGRLRVYPALDYYIDLVESMGVSVEDRRMELAFTDEGERAAEEMLVEAGCDAGRPLVMLNPGGAFGPSKRWPAERYAVVADELAGRHDAQIIINAAPNEKSVAAEVADCMGTQPLINFADYDNSLPLLKSLMRRCRLLVTNDTGARHIAAALGVGVVTIFGSTAPAWTTIDHPGERIIRNDVPCAPCQKKRCRQPAGSAYHQCMLSVSVEQVLAAAEDLLGQQSKGDPGGEQ